MDVQTAEIVPQVWGAQNETGSPWDKPQDFSMAVRFGSKADNLASCPNSKRNMRLRRLVGPPFAKKFLLDQEEIFKKCVRRWIEKIENLRQCQNGNVDIGKEGKYFTLDVISSSTFLTI